MQRDFLGELLEDLLEAFKTVNLLKGKAKIIDARVPIIKCTLDFGKISTSANSFTVLSGFCALYCHDMANPFFVRTTNTGSLSSLLCCQASAGKLMLATTTGVTPVIAENWPVCDNQIVGPGQCLEIQKKAATSK